MRYTYSEYKSAAQTPLAAKEMLLQKALLVCPDCGEGRHTTTELGEILEITKTNANFTHE